MSSLRHILLVDDEQLFLSSLRDGLGRLVPSIEVHVAYHGRAALEILASHPIDVVVTDLKMPELDGFQLLAAMHGRFRHVPAIVMSAFGTPEIESRVLGGGAIHYVDKPVDLHQLAARIRALLEGGAHGRLRGVSLPSLLQLLGMERKTGKVNVHCARGTAHLHFVDGQLVHASDEHGQGLDVALRTVGLDRVEIELIADQPPATRTIELPLNEVLFEAARLRDEGDQGAELDLDALDDFFGTEGEPGHESPPVAAAPGDHVTQQLALAMRIDGALGAALVDAQRGELVGALGGGPLLDIEVAATSNAAMVRAEVATMQRLGVDRIEDILVTMRGQYHLFRLFEQHPSLFLYLVVDRQHANLGMTRRLMATIERGLEVQRFT